MRKQDDIGRRTFAVRNREEEIVLRLIADNSTNIEIEKYTGLSIEEIEALQTKK
jgi:hypothetical protein